MIGLDKYCIISTTSRTALGPGVRRFRGDTTACRVEKYPCSIPFTKWKLFGITACPGEANINGSRKCMCLQLIDENMITDR